jgi:choline kinase
MKALILAAGTSSRLRPLTENRPKCLLKAGDKSLLEHTIDALLANDVRELTIVTGFLCKQIEQFVSESFPELHVTFIYNERYASANNIYSLWLAKSSMKGDGFLLLDSDLLFDKELITVLLNSPAPDSLALNRHPLGEEEIKVIADANNKVIEISKTCDIRVAVGESIGIEKISSSYAKALFDELDRMIGEEQLEDAFYEKAFERLIPKGKMFEIVDTTDIFCMEIDTAEDYKEAQSHYKSMNIDKLKEGLRVVLFCEHKYAISILQPLESEIRSLEGYGYEVLWFVDSRNIPDFPLKDATGWTNSIQEVYDFSPEVIFVPGNIVPYYLPGVKAEIFHGYAAEKKDHWGIRRYIDIYLTQGPFFTKGFEALARKYKDFEVKETGWPRKDWIYHHLHSFGGEKNDLLSSHHKKYLVLYAPTFSPSLTSLPFLKEGLLKLSKQRDVLILLKLHPLTKQEWADQYKALADENPDILWIDDHNVTKYQIMADVMISDTSSTIYEFLLLDKPVITYRAVAQEKFWLDIRDADELPDAFDKVLSDPSYEEKRKWIIRNYDPYNDGTVCRNMLFAVHDYIRRHGVPRKRKVNLWRKYKSIKVFGRIKRHG